MWVKTENGEAVRPEEFERSGNSVILRRGFELVKATEDRPEHYEYEEWQMTKEQYEIFKAFSGGENL